MKHSWLRIGVLLGFATALAAGCGGKSSVHDDSLGDSGESGSGSSGDTGSGASGGRTGNAGRAGNGSGGSRTGAGGTVAQAGQAGQGAGGSGGSGFDACSSPPPDSTPCNGTGFFAHDPATGDCFHSQGCPASAGAVYSDLKSCLAACPGSRPAPYACDTAEDCAWTVPGCCGGCEPVDPESIVGFNQGRYDAVSQCEPGTLCGACEDVTESQRVGQYFIPACEAHQCTVADLRASRATECNDAEDCMLRVGSGCCGSCGSQGIIAVSSFDWLDAICPDDFGCPDCVSSVPDNVRARCDDKRCVVQEFALR